MLIEGNALKIRTIRSILVKSGDIGQNFRTLSFSERCFDTQTNIVNTMSKSPVSVFLDNGRDFRKTEGVWHAGTERHHESISGRR